MNGRLTYQRIWIQQRLKKYADKRPIRLYKQKQRRRQAPNRKTQRLKDSGDRTWEELALDVARDGIVHPLVDRRQDPAARVHVRPDVAHLPRRLHKHQRSVDSAVCRGLSQQTEVGRAPTKLERPSSANLPASKAACTAGRVSSSVVLWSGACR